MKHPDVIIIGTGRSGTSAVARVLHERFAICFGHSPDLYSEFRGETVYEDSRLKERLREVIIGSVSVHEWRFEFAMQHRRCNLTGVKLLGFPHLQPADFLKLRPRYVIRTWRPREECVCSWIRYNGRGREWAEWYYDRVEAKLRRLQNAICDGGLAYTFLPFTTSRRWKDDELAELFQIKMEAIQKERSVA